MGRADSWMSAWSSVTWNEQDRLRIAPSDWRATTRRVVNDRPVRIRSTSYRSGAQSLGYHLAAVHPAPRVVGTDAHVDVGAVGFEGHQGGEVSDLESHGPCGGSAVKCHGHVEGDAVGHAVLVEPHPVGMARWGGQRILHVGRADTEESHRARNLLE